MEEQENIEIKKQWHEPVFNILNLKDTKGGVGANTTEDETWLPGSL